MNHWSLLLHHLLDLIQVQKTSEICQTMSLDQCFISSSRQPNNSSPSTGELMRMTRPMGEEDRIPRRRCSFFRKRLRVAVCDPWVPGVFSLRDGSDEWAMEAGGVPFHSRSTGGSAPGGGAYSSIQQKEGGPQAACPLCSLHTDTTSRSQNHIEILLLLSSLSEAAAGSTNSPTQAALWHDGWLFGPFLPMMHLSHLSESHRTQHKHSKAFNTQHTCKMSFKIFLAFYNSHSINRKANRWSTQCVCLQVR